MVKYPLPHSGKDVTEEKEKLGILGELLKELNQLSETKNDENVVGQPTITNDQEEKEAHENKMNCGFNYPTQPCATN